jgi:hypothetical protein
MNCIEVCPNAYERAVIVLKKKWRQFRGGGGVHIVNFK